MKRIAMAILAASACFGITVRGDGEGIAGRLYVFPNITNTKTTGVTAVSATFQSKIVDDAIAWGTNAYQMTSLAAWSGVLTNSESRSWDLSASTNLFGDAAALTKLKLLAVKVATNNAAAVKIAAGTDSINASIIGATNAEAIIASGGAAMFYAPGAAGYAIATNAHLLTLTNTGTNSATVELYIGGVE